MIMAKKRLLVIEDDADVAEMLVVYFTDQGYDVLHAMTGNEGVAMARAKFPNLVLLDVMLPDMDGFDVCRTLRTTTLTKYIPITFLTQRDGRSDKVAGLELGADDYVTKPFDIEELRLRVQGSLRRSSRESLQDVRTGLATGALIEATRMEIEGKPGWTLLDLQLISLAEFRENYSFIAADEALGFAAQTLTRATNEQGTPNDFVGTTGDDRFVIFTQAADVNALTEAIDVSFKEGVKTFYNFADSDRGYMLGKNEDGTEKQSPLMHFVVSRAAEPVKT